MNTSKPNNYTKHNGVIVSDSYAKRRIVARLGKIKGYAGYEAGIPLEQRKKITDKIIGNPWYRGLLVSYLEKEAYDLWLDEWADERIGRQDRRYLSKATKLQKDG